MVPCRILAHHDPGEIVGDRRTHRSRGTQPVPRRRRGGRVPGRPLQLEGGDELARPWLARVVDVRSPHHVDVPRRRPAIGRAQLDLRPQAQTALRVDRQAPSRSSPRLAGVVGTPRSRSMPSSGRSSISTQAWASRSSPVPATPSRNAGRLVTEQVSDDERAAQARPGGEGPDVGDAARAAHLASGARRQLGKRQLLGRRVDRCEVDAHAEQRAQARQRHPSDQQLDGADDDDDVKPRSGCHGAASAAVVGARRGPGPSASGSRRSRREQVAVAEVATGMRPRRRPPARRRCRSARRASPSSSASVHGSASRSHSTRALPFSLR